MNREIFKYGKFEKEMSFVPEERKTFQLRVKPTLEVVVKYPEESNDRELQDFLKRKYRWLVKQLNYFEQFQIKQSNRAYVSGESYRYLGRQYQLKVVESPKPYLKLSYGTFELGVPDTNSQAHKKLILERWYLDRRAVVFEEQYLMMQHLFDEGEFPKLCIEEMPKRWGSFRRGRYIALHPLLILAPKRCIDYVIVHELCHMKYRDHSSEYYAHLSIKMPDWQDRKDVLEGMLSRYVI